MMKKLIDTQTLTRQYETWLASHITLIPADIHLKHDRMRADLFSFMRATFYLWVVDWKHVCAHLNEAPHIMAVGDLHIENFGTWRDGEGRLVWGVNDFDEAARMPYTIDLVRLATSALVAIRAGHLSISAEAACDAILDGYTRALGIGGQPVVLAENHGWLRQLVEVQADKAATFWHALAGLPTLRSPSKTSAARKPIEWLSRCFPDQPSDGEPAMRIVHRRAGMGSLGRQRFAGIMDWQGGQIAREIKALTISAWHWQEPNANTSRSRQTQTLPHAVLRDKLIRRAVRAADPTDKLITKDGAWLVRRLAPDCDRVELTSLPVKRDEGHLLHMMGFETANIHLANRKRIDEVREDLKRQPKRWLLQAASDMLHATASSWRAFRRS